MSEWRVAPLREIADIRVSNVDKKSTPGEAPVRLCNYMDVYANDYIRADLPFMEATATAAEIQRFAVQQGDVMITKDSETPDDIGIPAVVTDQIEGLVCGYHLARIRPNRALVDPVYLAKQLALPEAAAYFAQRAAGSTRYGLSNRTIAEVPIRLAPLGQQLCIAEILAQIDGAIERTEVLIEKHQQIKVGLMHDLFTRGALLNGRRRKSFAEAPDLYQETALGPLPREWRPSTVGESFAIDSGITLGPHRRPVRRSRKYLRVANVHREQLRLDDVASIEALPGDEGYALEEGDLLVVEGHANPAEIGRCAMVNQDAAGMLFQNHLFRLRVNGIDKSFALLWLNSFHVQRYWERTCSTSSGLHTINRRMLKAVPLYVPSEAEQTRIVSAAASARAVLDGHVKMAAKLRAHNRGVMQDLLTGKVRVPLAETASA